MLRQRYIQALTRLALSLALLAFGAGLADAGDLEDRQRRHDRLTDHRGRLEGQLSEQSQRIRRLKAQPAGVARDFQLEAALRTSRQLATRLTKLQGRIHAARKRLAAAYDRAIQQADAKLKVVLRRRRARLGRKRQGANTRIVTGDRSSPYDSPEDLEEKADLLKDSEEKVRRQLRRLQRQLARLQHRARLRRHARAAEDNPFVENAPRRTSRVSAARKPQEPASSGGAAATTNGPTSEGDDSAARAGGGTAPPPAPPASDYDGKSNSGEQSPADPSSDMATGLGGASSPAPQPTGSGSWSGVGDSSRDAAGVSISVTIRDVIDPSLLRKLGQVVRGGEVKARITVLRRATSKLGQLAGRLSKKARSLRQRARVLRKKR